jgi:hypothetical protein
MEIEPQLDAIRACLEVMEPLDEDARRRVLLYIGDAYGYFVLSKSRTDGRGLGFGVPPA